MSKNRKHLLVGLSLTVLSAAGGATALASGGPFRTPITTQTSQGMTPGGEGGSMMKQLDAAAMRPMMRGMSMKLDEAQLKRMTEAHNTMVPGMMGDDMMSNADMKDGR